MSSLWFTPLPLHSGLAAHNWLAQILVMVLIAGVWLFLSGNIARRSASRRQRPPRPAEPLPRQPRSALDRPR